MTLSEMSSFVFDSFILDEIDTGMNSLHLFLSKCFRNCFVLGFCAVFSMGVLSAAVDPPLDPEYVSQPTQPGKAVFQPHTIMKGGEVITLFSPDSPFLKAGRLNEPEKYKITKGVPGRVHSIINIHNPSIEVHTVDSGRNTGTAIILIPGGGHRTLNVSGGGTDLIPYFYNFGVNTIILRNRLRNDGYNAEVDAVNDTMQAIRLVRSQAVEWKIDPDKIGVVGYSAGAELAGTAGVYYETFDKANNAPADPFAGVSSRPDFVGLIYPGPTPFRNNPDLEFPKDVPPSFIACAASGDANHAVWPNQYFMAMLNKKVPNLEMHMYGNGVHGGGLSDRGGHPFWHLAGSLHRLVPGPRFLCKTGSAYKGGA